MQCTVDSKSSGPEYLDLQRCVQKRGPCGRSMISIPDATEEAIQALPTRKKQWQSKEGGLTFLSAPGFTVLESKGMPFSARAGLFSACFVACQNTIAGLLWIRARQFPHDHSGGCSGGLILL